MWIRLSIVILILAEELRKAIGQWLRVVVCETCAQA